jgi:putative tryptophan/tyrosine transport system substrate-binding protein
MTNHIRRRQFINLLGGAAAAWPIAAGAQQRTTPVIGFLGSRTAAGDAAFVEAVRHGLSENGFVVGQNVAIEFRWAEGRLNRLPALATELVRRRVNVIITAGGNAAPAAKAATSSIPIVFSTGSDPVKSGLVPSLNRPSGNLTGVTTLSRALGAKRLGLLRDLLPQMTTFAHVVNPDAEQDSDTQITDVEEAAQSTGLRLLLMRVRNDRELEATFVTMVERGCGAFLLSAGAALFARSGLIIALAARHALPAIYPIREWPVFGGLMSYGTSFAAMYRQVGLYAGRILNGAKPAELPVMQPTRFELVINLNAAKALSLTIPPGVLAIADEVIE